MVHVDVAQGRWVKLLGARTSRHTRLRLYEFRALIDACERFLGLPEQLGAKPAAALRSAVQAQCKAYMEAMHTKNTTQVGGGGLVASAGCLLDPIGLIFPAWPTPP